MHPCTKWSWNVLFRRNKWRHKKTSLLEWSRKRSRWQYLNMQRPGTTCAFDKWHITFYFIYKFIYFIGKHKISVRSISVGCVLEVVFIRGKIYFHCCVISFSSQSWHVICYFLPQILALNWNVIISFPFSSFPPIDHTSKLANVTWRQQNRNVATACLC